LQAGWHLHQAKGRVITIPGISAFEDQKSALIFLNLREILQRLLVIDLLGKMIVLFLQFDQFAPQLVLFKSNGWKGFGHSADDQRNDEASPESDLFGDAEKKSDGKSWENFNKNFHGWGVGV
jgi:hypothetical protein